ncbi:MAG TPA: RNA degradosome polyphosphate kinase, partial [Candidatus Xenobia bacterium]
LSTGNYNDQTARIYTDLSLFTCRQSFGEDLTHLFNLLTGYARPPKLRELILSPTNLRNELVARIRREAEHARAGRPARLILKMNGLSDQTCIQELYQASQAGVRIDMLVRGICCLRPGVKGMSENIRVVSIVDRFLEHARIFYFENDGQPEYFLTSADMMGRNLDGRVEVMFPVLVPALQADLWDILQVQLADRLKARLLDPDSTSGRLADGEQLRSQERLAEMAQEKARKAQDGFLPRPTRPGERRIP